MPDFNSILGDGNGVVCVFTDIQESGTLFTNDYVTSLSEHKALELTDRIEVVAGQQGIFKNTPNRREYILRKIKENVQKVGVNYEFKVSIYVNNDPALVIGDVLDSIIADKTLNTFKALPNTADMDSDDGKTFLDTLL